MPDLEKIKKLRDELKAELQKDPDTAPWMKHNGKGDRLLRVVDRYIEFITPLLQPERKVTWDERNQLVRMIQKIENRWYPFDKEARKVGKTKHASLAKELTTQFLEHFDILQQYDWESDPAYFLTFAKIEAIYERVKRIEALQLDSDEGSNLLDNIHPKNIKTIKGIAFEASFSEEDEKADKTKKANLTLSFSNDDSLSDVLEDSETSFADVDDNILNYEPKELSFMDDSLLPEFVEGVKGTAKAPLSPPPANIHDQPIHLDIMSSSCDEIKTRPMLEQNESQMGQANINYSSVRYLGK